MNKQWYENTDRFIPVHWQASSVIELAKHKNMDLHRLLKGSGLFPEDFLRIDKRLSAVQFDRILKNFQQLNTTSSSAFLFGDRLLPGGCSAFTHALSHTENLYQTFELLTNFPLIAFPLLEMKIVKHNGHTGIELVNTFGIQANHIFIIEACMRSIFSWIKWQSNIQFPWRFEFNYNKPEYFEEYELHLGDDTDNSKYQFNRASCRVLVDDKLLFNPWPKGSSAVFLLALSALEDNQEWKIQQGFCGAVMATINRSIFTNVNLESLAATFNTSCSSFKRKLKQHNTSFQILLDQCRAQKAIELITEYGMNNEQIAERLNIRDASNFRRSFKRWTGFSPKDYRAQISAM